MRPSVVFYASLFCAVVERHPMAPQEGACGRGCAPVPNSIGGEDCLSVASSAALTIRDRGTGTQRAAPGRPWFWVLLPKQKDLAVRGRNPARISPSPGVGQRRGMIILNEVKHRRTPD